VKGGRSVFCTGILFPETGTRASKRLKTCKNIRAFDDGSGLAARPPRPTKTPRVRATGKTASDWPPRDPACNAMRNRGATTPAPAGEAPHRHGQCGPQLPTTTGRKRVPRGTRPYPGGAKPTAGSPPAGAENAARLRPPRPTKMPRVRATVKTTRGWRTHDGIRSRRPALLLACGTPSGVPSVAPPTSLSSRRPARLSGPAPRVIQPSRRRLPPRAALSFGNPPSLASAGAKSCASPAHCPTRRQPARSTALHSFGAHRGTRRQPGRRPTGASPTTVPVGHRCSASPVIR